VDVWLGRIRVHIQKLGGQPNPNRVQTPTAIISVRGTTFEVNVEDDDETTLVAVEEGTVAVEHRLMPRDGDPKILNGGDQLVVYRNSPLASSRRLDRGRVMQFVADALWQIMTRTPRPRRLRLLHRPPAPRRRPATKLPPSRRTGSTDPRRACLSTAAGGYTERRVTPALLLFFLAAQPPGVSPEWELKPKIEKIATEVGGLRPWMEKLQPERWTAAGAPQAYERQWKQTVDSIAAVQDLAARLAAQPLRLSLAVETLVRLESLLQLGGSVSQVVRRYQNPAVADLLDGELMTAGASREWLRQHVADLAGLREKELEVAKQEAQRCRSQLSRPGGKK
jgi:hypothetical protein